MKMDVNPVDKSAAERIMERNYYKKELKLNLCTFWVIC